MRTWTIRKEIKDMSEKMFFSKLRDVIQIHTVYGRQDVKKDDHVYMV